MNLMKTVTLFFMNRKFKRTAFFVSVQVFSVTFEECSAPLLNKTINVLKNNNKIFTDPKTLFPQFFTRTTSGRLKPLAILLPFSNNTQQRHHYSAELIITMNDSELI